MAQILVIKRKRYQMEDESRKTLQVFLEINHPATHIYGERKN